MKAKTSKTAHRLSPELQALRDLCGTPSYAQIVAMTKKLRAPISRTTVGNAMTGATLPQLARVLLIVQACRAFAEEVGLIVDEGRFSQQLWRELWVKAMQPLRDSQDRATLPWALKDGLPSRGILERLPADGLASEHARAILATASPGFIAVDDAICLANWAQPTDNLICRTDDTAVDGARYPQIEDPTREQLEHAISTCARDPQVAAYLRQQLPDQSAPGSYRYKASVSMILRGQPGDVIAPQIRIEPQLWWVEDTFNRQLLLAHRASPSAADSHARDLRAMGSRLVNGLLDADNNAGDYRFRFPSGLYVEVAVIDEDGHILVLAKDPGAGGGEAQSGRRWTCSMERGVEAHDIVAGHVDLRDVAVRGITRELQVDRTEVGNVEFSAIALQSRHLNCAVLGVARVPNVTEIAARAHRLPHFTAGRSVTLNEAADMLHFPTEEFSQGKWHATARLRIILALAQG
ncbi:hypothetical protein V7968_04945 [Nocardia vulneris]|uniref:hypothetical protein n=1 Tax=Nocardia vulneris TaxID=1141657 RepID=UPI0030CCD1C3